MINNQKRRVVEYDENNKPVKETHTIQSFSFSSPKLFRENGFAVTYRSSETGLIIKAGHFFRNGKEVRLDNITKKLSMFYLNCAPNPLG